MTKFSFKKDTVQNKIFLDHSIEYLILNDDYYYFVELSFIDTFARKPHDESRCFITYIKETSNFNYSPTRMIARLIDQ